MLNFRSLQKHFVLLFLFCSIPFASAFAQSTVKGTVNDESGEPIIGATVKVEGTSAGAITDMEVTSVFRLPLTQKSLSPMWAMLLSRSM